MRSKRIKTRFDQRLIGRTSGTSQRSVGLGSLFDSIFLETNSEQIVKAKKFYSSSSSPRIHIFNRSLTPLFAVLSSRTDNDVSLFLKCVLFVASRLSSPPPKKNRLMLYQIFISAHLYYADVVVSRRIYFKFYINSTS